VLLKYGKRLCSNINLFWIAFPVQILIFISFYSVFLLLLAQTLRSELDSTLIRDLKNRSIYLHYIIDEDIFNLEKSPSQSTQNLLDRICSETEIELILFNQNGDIIFNSYSFDASISHIIRRLHLIGLLIFIFTALVMSQFFRLMIKTVNGIKTTAINQQF